MGTFLPCGMGRITKRTRSKLLIAATNRLWVGTAGCSDFYLLVPSRLSPRFLRESEIHSAPSAM
jgi:hypothetical protein